MRGIAKFTFGPALLVILFVSSPPTWATLTVTSGLEMWLKADAITSLSDGDPVTLWPDSSGNSSNASQAVGFRQPTYRAAGFGIGGKNKPSVEFDGLNQYLQNASANVAFGGTGLSVFVAHQFTATAGERALLGNLGDGTNGYALYDSAHAPPGDFYYFQTFGGTGGSSVSGGLSSDAVARPLVLGGVRDAAQSALYTNGLLAAGPTAVTGTFGSTTEELLIGRSVGVGGLMYGRIAEVLIYSRALSGGEIASVSSYLYDKYLPEPTIALLPAAWMLLARRTRKLS